MSSSGNHLRKPEQILGFAISLLCFAVLVWQVDWAETVDAFRRVEILPLLAAALLLSGGYLLQTRRWRLILGLATPPPFRRLLRIVMIGYFGNAVLPLRAGDLLRAVVLRRSLGGEGVRALASIALERLFDVFTILAFGFAILPFVDAPPTVRRGLFMLASVAMAGAVGLVAVAKGGNRVLDVVRSWLEKRVPRTVTLGLDHFLTQTIDTTVPIIAFRRFLPILGLSILQWSLVATAVSCCIDAFQLSLPWQAGVVFMVVTNLGGAIPSAPAATGVFHGLGVLALAMWNVDAGTALAVAIVIHAIAVALQVAGGLVAVWVEGGLDALQREARSDASLTSSAAR